MTPKQRFDLLFDDNSWEKLTPPSISDDPLNFTDRIPYSDRLAEARSDTGCYDAITSADGTIGGVPSTICVLNGLFMMGSMGRAAGDAIVAAMEHAVATRRAFIMVTSSGGARMQEGILSLMQMARTTIAVKELNKKKIPYIAVLTNPTTGGVTASFAMLADITLAEPGAIIGFAGSRVIEQTIHETLPPNFQKSEYLLEHGMIDQVVSRKNLREKLIQILSFFDL
jgi:acetyl-CoA carboxylase carboxyl transferase subunit beta